MYDNYAIQYSSVSNKPNIKMNHIDGPLLHCSNGNLHWLTLWERFLFKFQLISIEQLDIKHR